MLKSLIYKASNPRWPLPTTWQECVKRALRVTAIVMARVKLEQANPWARKMHSLAVSARLAWKLKTVPATHKPRAKLDTWKDCVRYQRKRVKVSKRILSPWQRLIKAKVVSAAVRARCLKSNKAR